MKMILIEKVPTLGSVGEIVNVSAGYGRNYLLPNKLAIIADESNKKSLENHQRALAKKIDAEKKVALDIKKKVDAVKLTLIKKIGASGKLFGTVTTTELSKELAKLSIEVEKRQLVIENPIKQLGTYKVKAKLFTGVEGEFSVKVDIDPVQAAELKAQQEEAKKNKAKRSEAEKLASENPEAEKEEIQAEEQTEKEIEEHAKKPAKKKKKE